ncbi:MAG: hypothetical protein S4CHLAM2_09960 [Chlamydiales bacterium]|nr:hypothetical protein [Chlamydiales bacterium]
MKKLILAIVLSHLCLNVYGNGDSGLVDLGSWPSQEMVSHDFQEETEEGHRVRFYGNANVHDKSRIYELVNQYVEHKNIQLRPEIEQSLKSYGIKVEYLDGRPSQPQPQSQPQAQPSYEEQKRAEREARRNRIRQQRQQQRQQQR